MKNAIMNFVREEKGTELVEWALIAGFIIVIAAGVFAVMGTNLQTIYNALGLKVSQAASNVPAA